MPSPAPVSSECFQRRSGKHPEAPRVSHPCRDHGTPGRAAHVPVPAGHRLPRIHCADRCGLPGGSPSRASGVRLCLPAPQPQAIRLTARTDSLRSCSAQEPPPPLYAMLRPRLLHSDGAHLLIIGATEARDQCTYVKARLPTHHELCPMQLTGVPVSFAWAAGSRSLSLSDCRGADSRHSARAARRDSLTDSAQAI